MGIKATLQLHWEHSFFSLQAKKKIEAEKITEHLKLNNINKKNQPSSTLI